MPALPKAERETVPAAGIGRGCPRPSSVFMWGASHPQHTLYKAPASRFLPSIDVRVTAQESIKFGPLISSYFNCRHRDIVPQM